MRPLLRSLLSACLLSLLTLALRAQTGPAQFSARPYDVTEGDAMVFTYLELASTVKFSDIKSWKWDFDGNGTWDVQKSVNTSTGVTADQITTTWYSVLNTAAGTGSAVVRNYTPKLEITRYSNPTPITVVGVTQDVYGLDGTPDPQVIVRKKLAGSGEISASFSANPRLARAKVNAPNAADKTREIRFYAETSFPAGVNGVVTSITWDLDGNGTFTDATGSSAVAGVQPNPTTGLDFNYPAPVPGGRQPYTVAMRVAYTIDGLPGTQSPLTITQKDFVVIEDVPQSLSMGRAYRQGFPERYGWDDIVQTYQAADGTGNRYVYFNHFEDAFFEQQGLLAGDLNNVTTRGKLAESVNEMLQGQSMRGFQGMIEALRMRYPRITTQSETRLPAPAGTRDETAALETAALDFQQSLQYAAFAVRAYGPSVLRAAPDAGAPAPYPQFPNYLTYFDGTLTGGNVPIPAKNEYWQYATAAGGLAQARTEKAKLLWRLSAQEGTALPEAKEECKVAATQAYLNMALLASGQTETQFASNEGNDLLKSQRVATDLFDKINAGVNPLGTDGSYIPNETFSAIYQDATDAVTQAKAAEVDARNEKRTYDRNQADLRNELLAQHNQYLSPLKLLTGLDPATYNGLATVGDQTDFRNAFSSRLNNLLANYPAADASGLGEYGAQVAAILDAQLAVQEQITALNNLYEGIKISKWANSEVEIVSNEATRRLQLNDIIRGYANMVSFNVGFPSGGGVSISPGSFISGLLNADDRDIQRIQQAKIADIQLEAEIRRSLLQVANLSISIRRAGIALDQARLKLDSMKAQMEQMIADLAHTRQTAADLYFQDPSFRVFASQTERRAAQELDYAIDRLYRLAKTLQYEWTEAYQNPVIIPAASTEPPALESALFDKFPKLDSLFAARSADEAQDYLDALKAWDSKLRRVTGTSVRGPNHSAPLSAVPISLREKVFSYSTANGYTLEQSIAAFRNFLESNRKENVYNTTNPSLELHFPIGIADNSYFPATGSRWNLRIHSISVEIYAESGFSDQPVAEIDLVQAGMVSLRTYWANPPAADDLVTMAHNVDNYDRSVFATAFPAKVNGATGGRPAAEFDSLGLKGRPVATTDWVLRIDTENPANRNIQFNKIKDIVLKFTYTYGNPDEFPGF